MPDLYPYQRDGVAFLRSCASAHGAAVLADEMGVGKTPTAISAPPLGAAAVVVVPAALKEQTAERIALWRQDRPRVTVLDGLGSWRWPEPGEWIVCNPDILPASPAEVRRAEDDVAEAKRQAAGELPLDAGRAIGVAAAEKRLAKIRARGVLAPDAAPSGLWLLVDEAHEFNTAATAQTERLRAVVRAVLRASGRAVAITATPLLNEPSELRSFLATFRLGGVAWPASTGRALDYWGYLRDWGGAKGRFGEVWEGEPRDDAIRAALARVMLRRRLRDVVDLPAMLPTESIRVDLDEGVRRIADEADEMLRSRAADLAREEKIVLETCAKVRAALAVAKLPAAHDWCSARERESEPAVVACVSRDVVRAIGKRPGWARIDGEVSPEDRAAIVREFQAGKLRGVALTHRAGGVGIDLYRSARMLVVSREWNPALNRQTLARLVRQGQTRRVGLTMLYGAHPIEERLDELMERRKRYLAALDACAVRPVAA